MVEKICLNEIKNKAEQYYKNGEFYCSEAVVKTIKDAFELDITDDIIKMSSGFPVGIGASGCTCGAISGGIMMIGLFFGRSIAKDSAVNKAMELSAKLYKNFTDKHNYSCCKILTKNMIKGSEEHMKQCVSFTGEIAYQTAKIIAEELKIEIAYNS